MARGQGDNEICRLPGGCISHVISLTSPRDCCASAVVSTTFRSAAESDTVWERFLPPDYEEILSRAVDPVDFSSKRDLYFRLSDPPILIDSGTKSFAVERSSGHICYTLSARELNIIWGDTPYYWKWGRHDDSRFPEVAELLVVWWLEIRGRIDCKVLSQKTPYAAYLIFKLAQQSYGFRSINLEASVRVGSHVSEHVVCLQPDDAFQPPPEGEEINGAARTPRARDDGWMEMELGDFFNDDRHGGDVEMCLLEIKGGHSKYGLILEGIEVRPKK